MEFADDHGKGTGRYEGGIHSENGGLTVKSHDCAVTRLVRETMISSIKVSIYANVCFVQLGTMTAHIARAQPIILMDPITRIVMTK